MRLFFAFFLCLLIVSSSYTSDSYIFKAKGKFAGELKFLLEKYSKEGNVSVEIVKLPDSNNSNYSLYNLFSQKKTAKANVKRGREIYSKRCSNCHGENATKIAYNNSRKLYKISEKDIVSLLNLYKTDPSYGKSTKFIMQQEVSTMSSNDIKSVAMFIKTIKGEMSKEIYNSKK